MPELWMAFFGFLLHFAWESVQCPLLYEGRFTHGAGVSMCAWAAMGDVVIQLVAFWAASLPRGRTWVDSPTPRDRSLFLAAGLAITVAIELYATRIAGRWEYSPSMPVVFGIGVAPVVQWVVLPLAALALVRRMRAGATAIRA